MHFFNENKRVIDASFAIETNDIDLFVNNINKSGDSSYKLLQNCYAPLDTDQRVALGLAIADNTNGLKAVRIHGGGFAGTILCFVNPSFKDEFIERMSKIFKKENVFDIGIRNSGTREVEIKI
jgi:galactokinase